jgi:outer membrane protein assembly factor BamB
MNCEEVKEQIELYVLGDLSEEQMDGIERHLSGCADCSRRVSELRVIVSAIKGTGEMAADSSELERNILASVERQIGTNGRRRRISRRVLAVFSSAACLLIGLAIWQLFIYPGGRELSIEPHANLDLQTILTNSVSMPASLADDIVVREEKIFMLLENGMQMNAAAFNSVTGEQLWRSDIESYGFIAADDDQMYCLAPGAQGGLELAAINGDDGKTLWRYSAGYSDFKVSPSKPTVLSGGRICWIVNSEIYVLSASDGDLLWSRSIPNDNLLSEASAIGDKIFIAGGEALYCFDSVSGEQSWRMELGEEASRWVRPLLAVDEGQICVAFGLGSGKSKLFCMAAEDREVIWSKVTPQILRLCFAGENLYLRTQDVFALDRKSGAELWKFSSRGCSPVTYADSGVYFIDSNGQGQLVMLDCRTGDKVWDLIGMRSCDEFLRVGNTGYLKTDDGAIHIIAFSG